jgi:hypothetical protein
MAKRVSQLPRLAEFSWDVKDASKSVDLEGFSENAVHRLRPKPLLETILFLLGVREVPFSTTFSHARLQSYELYNIPDGLVITTAYSC